MANSKRALSVIMCTDPVASIVYENNQEKEYDGIEKELTELFPECSLSFKRNVFPHELANENCDLYLFDFGGMLPGCGGMVASHFGSFIQQAEDHPNTVFLLYSTFSVSWYKDLMEDACRDADELHNVAFYDYKDKWVLTVKKMLQLPKSKGGR